jgi:hypothetical protein
MNAIIDEIAAERRRQIEQEGWSSGHDDAHDNEEMARAAVCYAAPEQFRHWLLHDVVMWPWEPGWWKPRGRRRDLIRAAALIVAEIERLDRKAALTPPPSSSEGK